MTGGFVKIFDLEIIHIRSVMPTGFWFKTIYLDRHFYPRTFSSLTDDKNDNTPNPSHLHVTDKLLKNSKTQFFSKSTKNIFYRHRNHSIHHNYSLRLKNYTTTLTRVFILFYFIFLYFSQYKTAIIITVSVIQTEERSLKIFTACGSSEIQIWRDDDDENKQSSFFFFFFITKSTSYPLLLLLLLRTCRMCWHMGLF